MYIIIETEPIENSHVVTDEDGKVLTFESKSLALMEARDCQRGKIVEI